jgi:hypothetical protein
MDVTFTAHALCITVELLCLAAPPFRELFIASRTSAFLGVFLAFFGVFFVDYNVFAAPLL